MEQVAIEPSTLNDSELSAEKTSVLTVNETDDGNDILKASENVEGITESPKVPIQLLNVVCEYFTNYVFIFFRLMSLHMLHLAM